MEVLLDPVDGLEGLIRKPHELGNLGVRVGDAFRVEVRGASESEIAVDEEDLFAQRIALNEMKRRLTHTIARESPSSRRRFYARLPGKGREKSLETEKRIVSTEMKRGFPAGNPRLFPPGEGYSSTTAMTRAWKICPPLSYFPSAPTNDTREVGESRAVRESLKAVHPKCTCTPWFSKIKIGIRAS